MTDGILKLNEITPEHEEEARAVLQTNIDTLNELLLNQSFEVPTLESDVFANTQELVRGLLELSRDVNQYVKDSLDNCKNSPHYNIAISRLINNGLSGDMLDLKLSIQDDIISLSNNPVLQESIASLLKHSFDEVKFKDLFDLDPDFNIQEFLDIIVQTFNSEDSRDEKTFVIANYRGRKREDFEMVKNIIEFLDVHYFVQAINITNLYTSNYSGKLLANILKKYHIFLDAISMGMEDTLGANHNLSV